jgi:hypothetical protein
MCYLAVNVAAASLAFGSAGPNVAISVSRRGVRHWGATPRLLVLEKKEADDCLLGLATGLLGKKEVVISLLMSRLH